MRLTESSIPKGKSEVKQRNNTQNGKEVGWVDRECKTSTGILAVSSLSGLILVICPLANDSGMLNSQCACSNGLGGQK